MRKDRQVEPIPASVPPTGARQDGEIRARWAWVEPSIWTDRMLAALEDGVKGGVWFSLIDKVVRPSTLRLAWEQVRANKGSAGVDHQSVEHYQAHVEANLRLLHEQLQKGTYRPSAIRRVHIPKPGTKQTRPLGIPTVRDRVVQTALRLVLEPIFERQFAEQSYGFRPGRDCHDALERVEQLLADGCHYVVDADLKSYFDTIPHDRLMERVDGRVADGRVLALVEQFLKQSVLDEMEHWTPQEGTPQGAVISPLLSNLYLDPLDHLMAQQGYEMVRYADDFVVLCRSEQEAHRALAAVQAWTQQAGLTLHPQKTRVVDVKVEGFDFLGYRFEGNSRRPSDKSGRKLAEKLRLLTKRTQGWSLSRIVDAVNQRLRGWCRYFSRSSYGRLKRYDVLLRMRLRHILRHRAGRPGLSHGLELALWSNGYFTRLGLASLDQMHQQLRRSARR